MARTNGEDPILFPLGYCCASPIQQESWVSSMLRFVSNRSMQIGKLKKSPPKGREGVYNENSDFLRKKTNRRGEKHKLYCQLLPRISSDNFRKHAVG